MVADTNETCDTPKEGTLNQKLLLLSLKCIRCVHPNLGLRLP